MIEMEISDLGLTMIENFEGFSPIPYEDGAGKGTIGFGHKIRPDEEFTSITDEQGRGLLRQDVKFAESAICQSVCCALTQNEYDALTSLVYNIGGGNFIKSTLLDRLNDNDIAEAADEFLVWNHINGVVSSGLTRRRQTEKALFLTD